MTPEPQNHLFLRSELRALLTAVAMAAAGGNHSEEYEAGFAAAVTSIAVGLGIEGLPPQPQRTQTVTIEQPYRARLGGGR
jgi:hypothetical protein